MQVQIEQFRACVRGYESAMQKQVVAVAAASKVVGDVASGSGGERVRGGNATAGDAGQRLSLSQLLASGKLGNKATTAANADTGSAGAAGFIDGVLKNTHHYKRGDRQFPLWFRASQM